VSTVRVDRVVTSGTFSLDGGTWEVDSNVRVVGDDTGHGEETSIGAERGGLEAWIARGH
jgi:hypothetical protein